MVEKSLKRDLEDAAKNSDCTDFFEHLAYEFDWLKYLELKRLEKQNV